MKAEAGELSTVDKRKEGSVGSSCDATRKLSLGSHSGRRVVFGPGNICGLRDVKNVYVPIDPGQIMS